MEAWESSDRIRPLPPEAPPGSSLQRRRSPRGWVPLAIAAVALGAFAVGSTLFTRGEPDPNAVGATTTTTTTTTVPALARDPAATTTTTTTTLPPSLEARVPGLSNVNALVVDGTTTRYMTWASTDRGPRSSDVAPIGGSAGFDTTAALGALLSTETTGFGTLYVGHRVRFAARFVDVTSMSWHDERPGHIAIIARLPLEDTMSLLTAVVDLDGFVLRDLTRIATVDGDTDVVTWGDWGFAINALETGVIAIAEDPETSRESLLPVVRIFDAAGSELRQFTGWVADSAPAGRLLIRTFFEVVELTEAGVKVIAEKHEVIRTDPSLVPDGSFELLTPMSAAYLNPDDATMTEVTANLSGVTSVTSRNFDRPSNRSGSVPGLLEPLGFTEDGRLFILHDAAEEELVFVDWSNSTQYRLPVGPGTVVAVAAD